MTTNGVVVQADSVRVDFKATPTGDVLATTTAVYNPRGTQRLSMAGDWSFEMPLAAYDPDTMGTGRYAFGYAAFPSVSNYPLFAGRIEEGDDDLNPDIHTVAISGMDMLGELAKDEISQGEIWAAADEIPISVVGERWYAYEGETVIPMPNANDGDVLTEAGVYFDSVVAQVPPAPYNPLLSPEQVAAEWNRLIQHVKYLYFGHSAPFWRITLNIATDIVQSVASTISLQIINSSGEWETRTIDTNTTIVSGKPFAQSGYIEWTKQDVEHPMRHNGITQYWARIALSNVPLSLFKIKETTVRTMGPIATDVEELVDNYAPAGWSLATGSETGTADGGRQIYIAGQTALAVLVDLAKRTGEMFALIGTNQIKWLAAPITSGITAKEAPEGGDTSSSIYIRRLNRTRSRRDIVTRVYLRGGGNDPVAQVTLAPLDGLDISAYLGTDYEVVGDWLINTALEATLSTELPKTVNFPNIVALGNGTGRNRQNALELLRSGIAFLERNKEEARHYTAEIVGLRSSSVHPGMTMNVVANIYDANGNVTEEIDEDLVIVEMAQSMGNDGILSWRIVFGAIAEHIPTAALAEAAQIVLNQQKMNTPQAGSSNFAVGSTATGGSSGGGGGGGGSTAELAAHAAETFTAHQIPLQIDNKIATHAAIANAHHNPVTVTAPITLSGQLVGIATQPPITTTGDVLGVGVSSGLEIAGSNVRVKAGDGITVVTGDVAVRAGNGLGFSSGSLVVNAGDGLEIFSDNVRVKLSALSALEIVSGELRVKRGGGVDLSGGALVLDPSTLTAATTNATSGTGHTHAITATADAHALVSALLKADASGHIKLRSITINDNALIGQDLTVERDGWVDRDLAVGGDLDVVDDVTVGGDVDVTGNTTTATLNTTGNVDLHGSTFRGRNGRVGINREPDSQFDVDVLNALRAKWLIGGLALQLNNVTMIVNFDRALVGHRGQVPASTGGTILYQRGKFGEGLAAYPSLVNLVKNPSHEIAGNPAGTNYGTDGTLTLARSQDWAYRGTWSLKWSNYVSGAANIYWIDTVSPLATSTTHTWSVVVRRENRGTVSATQMRPLASWGTGNTGYVTDATYVNLGGGAWRISQTFTTGASAGTLFILALQILPGHTAETWYADSFQLLQAPYAGPIFDGATPGCTWTGTAHASTSTYAEPSLVYNALPVADPTNDRATQEDTLTPTEGSFLMWVNMAAVTSSNGRYLVYLEDDDDVVAVALYINTTGKVVGVVNDTTVTGATTITAAGWILVSMDWGEGGGVRVYLNGVLDGSGTYTAATVKQAETFRLLSGPTGFADNHPLIGVADMAVFVSRQLEEIEHRAVYESNAPVFAYVSTVPSGGETTSGGRYSLDDGGLQVFDAEGNLVGSTRLDGEKSAINYDVEELRIANGTILLNGDGLEILAVDGEEDEADVPTYNKVKFVNMAREVQSAFFQHGNTLRLVSEPNDGGTTAGCFYRFISPLGKEIWFELIAQGTPQMRVRDDAGDVILSADTTQFEAAKAGLKYTGGALTYKNQSGAVVTTGHASADANWIAPTLLNSWVNYAKSTAGYRLMPDGTVALKGVLKSGSSATAVMFTLPAAYRPSETRRVVGAANSAVGIVEITTAGDVSFVLNGSTTQSSLDGIRFPL